MNSKYVIGPILSVHLHEMCEAVHSYITVRYRQGNWYCFFEDQGTIDELCSKYKLIKRQNGLWDGRHHTGRKCVVFLEDGKTIFERYY